MLCDEPYIGNSNAPLQTVELVSYRMEDLKSGSIEISRVLECGCEDQLEQ